MKHKMTRQQQIVRAAAFLTIVAGMCGGLVAAAQADETKTAAKPPAPKKLTGAELYAVNCNRCHPERYPTEFNAAQWQTIMLHMRVRANLPAKQAKEILKYMKEEAGG